jgi:hypothetical protein
MVRSQYLELLDEQQSLPRGETGAFSMGELLENLKNRAASVARVQAAFESGGLTAEQRDELIARNRRHSLPRQG